MSFIAHIGNTIFGMYQMKYNQAWDDKLNKLIDEHYETATLKAHTISLGVYDVWICNKWYCYGNVWRIADKHVSKYIEFRPSIFTMRKLDRLVTKIKEEQKAKQKALQQEQIKEFFS